MGRLPYRTIITQTRYGGTYEGGEWMGLFAHAIPDDALGDDITCSEWWEQWGSHPAVAVGDSVEDVVAKLRQVTSFDNRYPTLPPAAYGRGERYLTDVEAALAAAEEKP